MLDATQKMKIKSFLADTVMSESVESVIMERFTMGTDITANTSVLAGQRIAQILLNVAYKDLQKYASQTEKDDRPKGQIAL